MKVETCRRTEDGRTLPYLVATLPPGAVVLSSAPVGGGFGDRSWIINAQVPLGYDRTDLDAHIDELRLHAGLDDSSGIGMLTGASVEHFTTSTDRGVHVLSTVGVSEPEWAATRGPTRASHAGTINTVAWVPVALSAAAMVNAVITVTEAKAQALNEAGLPGTGTATDAVCIACTTVGVVEPFAGPRSTWGSRLAVAAHATFRDGIARALAATP
jgi:adenosylcobinamide amidohydrolase